MRSTIMKIWFFLYIQNELLNFLVNNKFDSSGFKLDIDYNQTFDNVLDQKSLYLIQRG